MRLFDNTEVAFAAKSDVALERAYFLFKLIANEPLVRMITLVANFALSPSACRRINSRHSI